jgi:curved DNA-binding protein CbpA
MTYYEILGVEPDADLDAIKRGRFGISRGISEPA